MIAFTHQGTTVTPGQALDAFLATGHESVQSWFEMTHLFADAMYGYSGPRYALELAGIEITLGDEISVEEIQ